jgi:MFS family permease
MSSVPEARPVGYLALLRGNRSYRLMWAGQVVSLLGDWFGLVASAVLVGRLTGSALAVSGLFLVRMLPPFLMSPIAGVAADRYDRRLLLVGSDLIRAVTVLGFFLVREPSDVWLLYALTAVQLSLTGVFFPARNALLPMVVGERELGTANALGATSWSVMLALGAALGGLVAGQFGVRVAFAIDATSYLLSAALLMSIPGRFRPTSDRTNLSVWSAGREYFDGLTYLWRHREVLFVSLHKAIFGLTMGGALQVVQVTLAQTVFVIGEGGSTSLGLMYAMAGVGTGVGPIVARRLTGDDPAKLRRMIIVGYLSAAVGLAIIAPLASFAVVLVGIFIRGFGNGVNWVFSTQLLMMQVPNDVRGRVFSTEFAAFTLAQAVGTAIGGWAIDFAGFGLSQIVITLTMLPLIPGALWVWWIRRHPVGPPAAP